MNDKLTIEQLQTYKNTYDCFDGIPSNEFDAICDELIEYKQLEKKLGYSLKEVYNESDYKKVEEQCPLDVRKKVVTGSYVYVLATINTKVKKRVEAKAQEGFVIHYGEKERYMAILPWDTYKKSWWLKEDGSE